MDRSCHTPLLISIHAAALRGLHPILCSGQADLWQLASQYLNETINLSDTPTTSRLLPRLFTPSTLAQYRTRISAPRTFGQLSRIRRPLGVRRLFRQIVVNVVPIPVPEIVQPRSELVFRPVALDDVLVVDARAVQARGDMAPFLGCGAITAEEGYLGLAEL